MGLWASVSTYHNPPNLIDASGNMVIPSGSLTLTWMGQIPAGTRVYTSKFLVLANLNSVDILAGRNFIQNLGLVRLETHNFLRLRIILI